jgi:hypothetical protein
MYQTTFRRPEQLNAGVGVLGCSMVLVGQRPSAHQPPRSPVNVGVRAPGRRAGQGPARLGGHLLDGLTSGRQSKDRAGKLADAVVAGERYILGYRPHLAPAVDVLEPSTCAGSSA